MIHSSPNPLQRVALVLKNTLALLLWRFKDNFKVLLPLLVLQIYTQYQLSFLLVDFLSSTQSNDPLAMRYLLQASVWTALYSGLAFMIYADITRRLLGLPLVLRSVHDGMQYFYWLFKKSIVLSLALFIVLGLGFAVLSLGLGSIGFVMAKLLNVLNVNLKLIGAPLTGLFILLIVMAFIWLVARYLLMLLPMLVDTDKGPMVVLKEHATWMKPKATYAQMLAFLSFVFILLSSALNRLAYQSFSFKPGTVLSWETLIGPLTLRALLSEGLALVFICYSVAIYQQCKAERTKEKPQHPPAA